MGWRTRSTRLPPISSACWRCQGTAARHTATGLATSPSNPAPTTWYRKRYTANWHLKDALKASDFIFKSLLPSFRGYLLTGADGRLQIRSRRPTITATIQDNLAPGATTVEVDDALAWRNLALPVTYALIGAGMARAGDGRWLLGYR